MGKFLKKGKVTGEVGVMEVSQQASLGVRTRAKTLALQRLQKAVAVDVSAFSYLELRSRRLEKRFVAPAKVRRETPRGKASAKPSLGSSPEAESELRKVKEEGRSLGSAGSMPMKGCSSRKEGEGAEETVVEASPKVGGGDEVSFGDNAVELEGGRNTRENTPCSLTRDPETIEVPGSSTRRTKSITTNRRRSTRLTQRTPSTQDIEDLFAKPEKQQQNDFKEKYNFDPVNEQPLPGRYEWVKLES
ncbi:cyclin-dependent kinase inhibitor 5-like [Typha angustifolia]|uniref:cyclin-dependent kinase inhibitor 5-like n=1 Tax=Typha angustifolia TaxID=59011 RepID=UPI003C2D137F